MAWKGLGLRGAHAGVRPSASSEAVTGLSHRPTEGTGFNPKSGRHSMVCSPFHFKDENPKIWHNSLQAQLLGLLLQLDSKTSLGSTAGLRLKTEKGKRPCTGTAGKCDCSSGLPPSTHSTLVPTGARASLWLQAGALSLY